MKKAISAIVPVGVIWEGVIGRPWRFEGVPAQRISLTGNCCNFTILIWPVGAIYRWGSALENYYYFCLTMGDKVIVFW